MTTHVWWYLSRASGLVAWAALAASMVWGILLATRLLRPHDRPAWLLDLHRWFGALALVFTGLHLAALLADSYVQFRVVDLFVPFASAWRPNAVALGVASLYLLVTIQVTSWMRTRIPRRVWRGVHLSSYALALFVALHAATAGGDVGRPVYRWFAVVLIALLVVMTVTRVLVGTRQRPDTPAARAARNTDSSRSAA